MEMLRTNYLNYLKLISVILEMGMVISEFFSL